MGPFGHAIKGTPDLWEKFHRKRIDFGGKKSTFKNLSLSIHKNKSPCCIQTRDLRVYIERDTHPVFVILTDSKWVEIDILCRTVIKRLKSWGVEYP